MAVALVTSVLLPIAASSADPPPPPGLGVRLLDAPTNRADDPRAHVYVVDQVRPGTAFTRHVEVSDGDATPMDVLLYPATAAIADGKFEIANRGAPGYVPQWITVSPDHVHLAPGQRFGFTVTVRVPRDAPPGEQYGAIVAERPASRRTGVNVALRAAIRVYLSVGPGGEPPSSFTVDTLTAGRDASGRPKVVAQVHNTGGRALDMSGTLRLANGPGGLSAGPFPATLGTTLGIGQTEPVTVLLDKALPAGPWTATLELRSGVVRHKVEGRIMFPEMANTWGPPVKAKEVPLYEKRIVVVPIAASLIGVVSLALLVLALLAWRRRREEQVQPA